MKRPPQEEGVRLEAMEKSSPKGPLDERLRLKEAQKSMQATGASLTGSAEKIIASR